MRIIAGQCGGAQLYAPRGMDTRPTQDKVKESLFSIIQAYVPGARVLDLFAGSGALALEALSRGADFAALADRDREAVSCIRRNGEKLRFMERGAALRGRLAAGAFADEGGGSAGLTWCFWTRLTACRCWRNAVRRLRTWAAGAGRADWCWSTGWTRFLRRTGALRYGKTAPMAIPHSLFPLSRGAL